MTRASTLDLELMDRAFGDLPKRNRVRIFGVDYARLRLMEGGELYVTRTGWKRMPALLPDRWFLNRRFVKQGCRLPGGSGNVYRIDSPAPTKPGLKLVVKFARSGQDVPLHVAGTFTGGIPEEDIFSARWNSPFEELGLVNDLRRGRYGPPDLRIRTKRPLAIYCPPREYRDWQLGRSSDVWRRMERALEHASEIAEGDPVRLHSSRIYVMLFEWVEGMNAEDCCRAGLIDESEMLALTSRVVRELELKGFRVLDNKPRHFILRSRPDSGGDAELVRRGGELVYALIDFELLKRTPEHEAWLYGRNGAREGRIAAEAVAV